MGWCWLCQRNLTYLSASLGREIVPLAFSLESPLYHYISLLETLENLSHFAAQMKTGEFPSEMIWPTEAQLDWNPTVLCVNRSVSECINQYTCHSPFSEDPFYCWWEGTETASDGLGCRDEKQRLPLHRQVLWGALYGGNTSFSHNRESSVAQRCPLKLREFAGLSCIVHMVNLEE